MMYFIIAFTIIFFSLIFIALKFSRNDLKGIIGEVYVYLVLRIFLGNKYRILNDVHLPRPGKTNTQIDHIVIGPGGIFVVETKNMRGEIVGRKENPYWAQLFSMFDRRSFLSPIIQNDIHVNAVKRMLPFYRNKVFNCVVFVNNNQLDLSKDQVVFNVFSLIKHIKAQEESLYEHNVLFCNTTLLAAKTQST